MKLFQKPVLKNNSSTLIRVDNDTFAELIEERKESYLFKITFKISLSTDKKTLSDYEKVKVTVKRRDISLTSRASIYSNKVSEETSRLSNKIPVSKNLLSSRLKPNNGLSRPVLTSKVSDKLYSGLQLLKDLDAKEDFLEQVEISLNSYIDAASFNQYTLTELTIPVYRSAKKELRIRDQRISQNLNENSTSLSSIIDPSPVDPSNTMQRINRELVDITSPVSDHFVSRLSTESYLENPSLRMKFISNGKSPLFYDISRYYLNSINGRSDENTLTSYESRKTTKEVDFVDIETFLSIKKGNRNSNLDVRFDLFKRGSNVIDETCTSTLYVSSHTEAFQAHTNPPTVSALNVKNNSWRLLISDVERNTVSYNVYLKSIFQDGSVSSYVKMGNIAKEQSGPSSFSFFTTTNLSIARVIPVDSSNKETNIFTNTVIGPGHKVLGRPIILPAHFGKSQARIDVLKIPKNTVFLSLYRRDCTDNIDSSFLLVETTKIKVGNNNSTIIDKSILPGRIYEYYLVALSLTNETGEEIPSISNFVMFKNLPNDSVEKSINVEFKRLDTGRPGTASFQIKTTASKTENERITETLKSQLGELYKQFLDPSNNASSPLGDSKGIPQYSDLFFHEIVRTNLNTGERETFDLVSDGVFVDGPSTQRNFNIKPLNPQHTYFYNIFTFRKNPLEIFKKYVATGVDKKGKEWFYLPYKWKNPSEKSGKLFADDIDGVPVIDAYENFTSEAFGLTASYQTSETINNFSIAQVTASRIDRNTVKVSWSLDESLSLSNSDSFYDSFVIMKVVNGIRSFVGRSYKNYIYHELKETDLGTVYYIVVPILSEFDIGKESFSNEIFIEPDGLTLKTRVVNSPNDLR